jgi:hypothetical protein
VIVELLFVKPGERFVELRTVGVVLDSALEEILPEGEVFVLPLRRRASLG